MDDEDIAEAERAFLENQRAAFNVVRSCEPTRPQNDTYRIAYTASIHTSETENESEQGGRKKRDRQGSKRGRKQRRMTRWMDVGT